MKHFRLVTGDPVSIFRPHSSTKRRNPTDRSLWIVNVDSTSPVPKVYGVPAEEKTQRVLGSSPVTPEVSTQALHEVVENVRRFREGTPVFKETDESPRPVFVDVPVVDGGTRDGGTTSEAMVDVTPTPDQTPPVGVTVTLPLVR